MNAPIRRPPHREVDHSGASRAASVPHPQRCAVTACVIDVVDTEEHIERLLPILDEMLQDGLVTIEKVRVERYRGSNA